VLSSFERGCPPHRDQRVLALVVAVLQLAPLIHLIRDRQAPVASRMIAVGLLLVRILCDCFKSRRRLEAEILILRHQLNVLRRRAPRGGPHLRWVDRVLLIWLYRRCLASLMP
jgi:hypothetical protein